LKGFGLFLVADLFFLGSCTTDVAESKQDDKEYNDGLSVHEAPPPHMAPVKWNWISRGKNSGMVEWWNDGF
jgi:hypothetical protein